MQAQFTAQGNYKTWKKSHWHGHMQTTEDGKITSAV